MELLAKGAQKQQVQETAFEPSAQPATRNFMASPSQPVPTPNSTAPTESCELCKEEFRLAMVGGNAKYGHCFCGAAYHKDCYEGVLEADGLCVRCGRKLDKVLQKETRDEMKKIKSVFGD